jgi:hypothetical protein
MAPDTTAIALAQRKLMMTIENEREALLAQQAPPVAAIARHVRTLILDTGLPLEEGVSTKLSNLTFKHNGVVAALTLHKAHVNLHFYKGTELSDPQGILQGGGKALRHIRFENVGDVHDDIVVRYFREAYRLNQ